MRTHVHTHTLVLLYTHIHKEMRICLIHTPTFPPSSSAQAAIPWGLKAMEQLEACMRTLQPIKTK